MSQSRVLAILLTDIQNFTDRTSKSTRSGIFRLVEKHQQLVLPVLQRRGGTLVKTIGDAFLVVFPSPTDAVLAGIEVQDVLARFNAGVPTDQRIDVRIAINMGEISVTENDIYGEPVNIVSRIEGVAEPGEVFFTEAVYLNMNKAEVPSSEVGWLQLKGVAEKVRVYKVRRERPLGGEDDAAPRRLEEKGAKAWPVSPTTLPKTSDRTLALFLGSMLVVLLAATWLAVRHARVAKPPTKTIAFHAFRDAAKDFHQDCSGDVKRLCAGVAPGGGRIIACLQGHRGQVSPACRNLLATRRE